MTSLTDLQSCGQSLWYDNIARDRLVSGEIQELVKEGVSGLPCLAHDTHTTLSEAMRLAEWVDCPNLMIKIPATAEGLPAIEEALFNGLNVNVTLIFSRKVYGQVMETYLTALERRRKAGKPVREIASVASFFVSRVETLIDRLLDE